MKASVLKSISLKICIFVFIALTFSGCLFVKQEVREEEEAPTPSLQVVKPEILMSDQIIRSKKGDMIAQYPQDWFLVDVEDKVNPDVFAMAVNSDYTLGAVFSVIRKSEKVDESVRKEGVIGLAKAAFDRRAKKSAGTVALVGGFSELKLGGLQFGRYQFTSQNKTLASLAAVFVTESGQACEFDLIPMNITGKPIPDKLEIERIFNSILATVKY